MGEGHLLRAEARDRRRTLHVSRPIIAAPRHSHTSAGCGSAADIAVAVAAADSSAAATGLSRLQMRDVLMGADAFVLPTRGEGWGLPVVEAMAMALPVIVTNTSGCSQYLTQENSFPLTPTPTTDGFSEPHVPQLQVQPLRAQPRRQCV